MRFFLSGTFVVFTAGILYFFRAHILRFYGWDLAENFMGTVDFARVVSKTFSREDFFFFTAGNPYIFTQRVFFHGEKKGGGRIRMMALEKRYVDP